MTKADKKAAKEEKKAAKVAAKEEKKAAKEEKKAAKKEKKAAKKEEKAAKKEEKKLEKKKKKEEKKNKKKEKKKSKEKSEENLKKSSVEESEEEEEKNSDEEDEEKTRQLQKSKKRAKRKEMEEAVRSKHEEEAQKPGYHKSSVTGIALKEFNPQDHPQAPMFAALNSMSKAIDPAHRRNEQRPPVVNTAAIELEAGEILMAHDTRLILEYMLVALSLILLLSAGFDFYQINKLQKFLSPFPLIFGSQVSEIPVNFTEELELPEMQQGGRNRVEESKIKRPDKLDMAPQNVIYLCFAIAYGLFNFCKLSHTMSTIESESEMTSGTRGSGFIFLFGLLSTGAVIGTLGATWEISHLNSNSLEALRDNLNRTMFYYALNYSEKVEMDRLQIEYNCCGVDSYRDYFIYGVSGRIHDPAPLVIREINNSRLFPTIHYNFSVLYNRLHSYKTHDVPFSCCDPKVLDQCRIWNVDNSLGFYQARTDWTSKKDPYPLSIFTEGCAPKIHQIFELIALQIEAILMFRVVLECLTGILFRMVHSSYTSEYQFGHRPSIAHIPALIIAIYTVALGCFYVFGRIHYKFGLSLIEPQPIVVDPYADTADEEEEE